MSPLRWGLTCRTIPVPAAVRSPVAGQRRLLLHHLIPLIQYDLAKPIWPAEAIPHPTVYPFVPHHKRKLRIVQAHHTEDSSHVYMVFVVISPSQSRLVILFVNDAHALAVGAPGPKVAANLHRPIVGPGRARSCNQKTVQSALDNLGSTVKMEETAWQEGGKKEHEWRMFFEKGEKRLEMFLPRVAYRSRPPWCAHDSPSRTSSQTLPVPPNGATRTSA